MGKVVTAGKIASNVQKKITRAQEKVRHFNHQIAYILKYIIFLNADLSVLYPTFHHEHKAVSVSSSIKRAMC